MRAAAAAVVLGLAAATAAGCSSGSKIGAILPETAQSVQSVQSVMSKALAAAQCDGGTETYTAGTDQTKPFYRDGTPLQTVQCDNGMTAFVSPDGRRPSVPARMGNLQPFIVGANYVITANPGDDADFLSSMCSVKRTDAAVTVYDLRSVNAGGGYYGIPTRATC